MMQGFHLHLLEVRAPFAAVIHNFLFSLLLGFCFFPLLVCVFSILLFFVTNSSLPVRSPFFPVVLRFPSLTSPWCPSALPAPSHLSISNVKAQRQFYQSRLPLPPLWLPLKHTERLLHGAPSAQISHMMTSAAFALHPSPRLHTPQVEVHNTPQVWVILCPETHTTLPSGGFFPGICWNHPVCGWPSSSFTS